MHIVLSSPKAQPRQLRIPPLGMVQDTWVATEFFRAYFQGTISPPVSSASIRLELYALTLAQS